MLESKGINDNTTTKLFVAKYAPRVSSPKFCACSDPVPFLEWLFRALPFHCNEVDEDVEALVATVISKLLSSPSSPSLQIMANCTFLACVLVGVDFDKKDIVRVDKRCC
ncbi:hypothetical protein BDR07DRAFT_1011837 [Suillus spraguei]|nr:hypothetical protein BDR07DRAFT_1011837 [Suillus spraguei]